LTILIFNVAGILLMLGGLVVLVFGAADNRPDHRPGAAAVVWMGWALIGAAAALAGWGIWRLVT
jgi:hypothetical protein